MLLNLQLLDIEHSQAKASNYHDAMKGDRCQPGWIAPERLAECHETTNDGKSHEQDDKISVDAVEKNKYMPDDGDELEEDEEAARDDAVQMEHHPELFPSTVEEVVAFSWSCVISRGEEVLSAEHAKVVEVWSATQGEGEGADSKNRPEEEVVALLETDKPVKLPPEDRQTPR